MPMPAILLEAVNKIFVQVFIDQSQEGFRWKDSLAKRQVFHCLLERSAGHCGNVHSPDPEGDLRGRPPIIIDVQLRHLKPHQLMPGALLLEGDKSDRPHCLS